MTLFVMWHLGMGDAIICSGMIRELAKIYEEVWVPVYLRNLKSVQDMFSDVNNILVEEVHVDSDIFTLQMVHENNGDKILKLGLYGNHPHIEPHSFDQSFYYQADVPFSKRWDSFKIPENPLQSQAFVVAENLGETTIFIADSDERGFRIDDSRIESKLYKLRPWKVKSIFEYAGVISRCAEIHCIDSSLIHLVESIPTKGALFYHLYPRNAGPYHQAKRRKTWKILT